ncbi:MAG: hypothetical protein ABTQ26_14750, partial [Azonexus sp.]
MIGRLISQFSGLRCMNSRWINNLSMIFFCAYIFCAIRYQFYLLDYFEWGDESETIVAAKMIASGSKLYSEIFNHHGPLVFIPGVILEMFGSFGVAGHRVFIAILQILALLSIYSSPLFESPSIRKLYTIIAGTVMLLYLPDIYGHTYIYQVMAGLLLIIILAQYTIPAILIPDKIEFWRVVVGNFLISSLVFLSVAYSILAIFLFLASLNKRFVGVTLISAMGGAVVNIALLALIGSIPGFIAFHIYLNSNILPLYNGAEMGLRLVKYSFSSITADFAQFSAVLLLLASISRLGNLGSKNWYRAVFVLFGILSLLTREAEFHKLPYYYALLA